AFQREDHRAGGMDQGAMDHGAMDHGAMDHGAMDHGAVDQEAIHHGAMDHRPTGMGMGGMGMGMGMGMGGGDAAFAADMQVVHQLLASHGAITRTVEHLPNGIRTVTESPHREIA